MDPNRDENGKTDHDHIIEIKTILQLELPHLKSSVDNLKVEFACHKVACDKRFEKIDSNFEKGSRKFDDLEGWRNKINGALGIIGLVWMIISGIIVGLIKKVFFNGGN